MTLRKLDSSAARKTPRSHKVATGQLIVSRVNAAARRQWQRGCSYFDGLQRLSLL